MMKVLYIESHFGGSARRLGIACRAAVAGLRMSMVLESKRRGKRKLAKGNRVMSVWNVVDALIMTMEKKRESKDEGVGVERGELPRLARL